MFKNLFSLLIGAFVKGFFDYLKEIQEAEDQKNLKAEKQKTAYLEKQAEKAKDVASYKDKVNGLDDGALFDELRDTSS